MNMIRSLLLAIALIMTLNLAHSQIANDNVKEFEKQSMLLIQKLYSCQSIAYSVIGEQDNKTRYLYINLGNKYYNEAYTAFNKMQGVNDTIGEKLRDDISTLLQIYAKAFESMDALNKPESAIALSFAKQYLKKINEVLICKQT